MPYEQFGAASLSSLDILSSKRPKIVDTSSRWDVGPNKWNQNEGGSSNDWSQSQWDNGAGGGGGNQGQWNDGSYQNHWGGEEEGTQNRWGDGGGGHQWGGGGGGGGNDNQFGNRGIPPEQWAGGGGSNAWDEGGGHDYNTMRQDQWANEADTTNNQQTWKNSEERNGGGASGYNNGQQDWNRGGSARSADKWGGANDGWAGNGDDAARGSSNLPNNVEFWQKSKSSQQSSDWDVKSHGPDLDEWIKSIKGDDDDASYVPDRDTGNDRSADRPAAPDDKWLARHGVPGNKRKLEELDNEPNPVSQAKDRPARKIDPSWTKSGN